MFCGFFAERVTVGDLGVCAHGVWKTEKDRQLQWGVVFQAFCLFSYRVRNRGRQEEEIRETKRKRGDTGKKDDVKEDAEWKINERSTAEKKKGKNTNLWNNLHKKAFVANPLQSLNQHYLRH